MIRRTQGDGEVEYERRPVQVGGAELDGPPAVHWEVHRAGSGCVGEGEAVCREERGGQAALRLVLGIDGRKGGGNERVGFLLALNPLVVELASAQSG